MGQRIGELGDLHLQLRRPLHQPADGDDPQHLAGFPTLAADDDHRIVLILARPGERERGEPAHRHRRRHHERRRLADQFRRPLLVEREAVRSARRRVVVLAGDQVRRPAGGGDDDAVEIAVGLEQPVEVLAVAAARFNGERRAGESADPLFEDGRHGRGEGHGAHESTAMRNPDGDGVAVC